MDKNALLWQTTSLVNHTIRMNGKIPALHRQVEVVLLEDLQLLEDEENQQWTK